MRNGCASGARRWSRGWRSRSPTRAARSRRSRSPPRRSGRCSRPRRPAATASSSRPWPRTSPRRPSTARARWRGFKPKGRNAGEEILDELRAVNALLVEKAAPEEAEQFRELLKTAAQNTAKAAKEGGFLGFRAELVSEREQQMLDRLADVFHETGQASPPDTSSPLS